MEGPLNLNSKPLQLSWKHELGRMHLIEPNGKDLRRRPIVWSHPALTQDAICVRNDDSIACYKF